MFLKLFKHTFCKNLKTVIVLFSTSVAISLLTGILYYISKSVKHSVYLTGFVETVLAFSRLAISILCSIPVIMNYYAFHKSIATDEAYLTFTLPATTKQHINSRILSIICWSIISAIILGISLSVLSAFTYKNTLPEINLDINLTAENVITIIEIIILAIAVELASILHVVFAIVLNGALSTKIKGKGSAIIVVLILYAEITILGVICVLGILFAVSAEMHVNAILPIAILIVLALGVLAYYLSYKMLDRGLNVA